MVYVEQRYADASGGSEAGEPDARRKAAIACGRRFRERSLAEAVRPPAGRSFCLAELEFIFLPRQKIQIQTLEVAIDQPDAQLHFLPMTQEVVKLRMDRPHFRRCEIHGLVP